MVSTEEKGSVCLEHGCSLCCQDTRMPLTKHDIGRLRDLGYESKDFVTLEGGEKRLRNVKGKCFFLKDGRCKIYRNRPEGCRIYPLIYYTESKKAEIDPDCPHHQLFQLKHEDIKKLKRIIRTIEKENS
jgi:hypothetical protein